MSFQAVISDLGGLIQMPRWLTSCCKPRNKWLLRERVIAPGFGTKCSPRISRLLRKLIFNFFLQIMKLFRQNFHFACFEESTLVTYSFFRGARDWDSKLVVSYDSKVVGRHRIQVLIAYCVVLYGSAICTNFRLPFVQIWNKEVLKVLIFST